MSPGERPSGIPGSGLSGPHPVGSYAAALRDKLRAFARVQVFGELVNWRRGGARVYFELRDGSGSLPCSMWAEDWDVLRLREIPEGTVCVVAGGCDFYPGSRSSSASFTFAVTRLRVAGEGDLLAQIEQLRRRLLAEGLCDRQRTLPRPAVPRTIGVVTGENGKARDDVLAGLRRRGWAGRVVWAFAPVQDRRAAPAITRALQDLAACPEVDVIVVARGGGSLADLFCFCDETLCRTVAMLRVPVISSVGHHTDRTVIDDVAAIACSTPTHAAEAAVPVDCAAARATLHGIAARLERQGRRAVLERARALARMSRAPSDHVARHRARLHQDARDLRAAAVRGLAVRERDIGTRALVLGRKAGATGVASDRSRQRVADLAAALDRSAAGALDRRRGTLAAHGIALAAHDPQRTLERGFALVEDADGAPVTSAGAASSLPRLTIRLHDGTVRARPEEENAP
jgi:exodeoxyribonuclease VII large subunit